MDIIESQLRQTFSSVVWTHKIHEKQADIYRSKYNFLEIIKIFFSAVTSAGLISVIFVDQKGLEVATAVISLITVALNLYSKSFNLVELANNHKASALELLRIREEYISLLCDIKNEKLSIEDVMRRRDELLIETNRAYSTCMYTSERANKLADKSLKDKKKYTSDEKEIDKFLPPKIRKIR